jgi:myo-inositol-1-phosphate synthase
MPIKVAIVGVGNCASSLIQGVEYYKRNPQEDFNSPFKDLIDYKVQEIEFVAAFDVDKRKVGLPLSTAIFSPPNNTKKIFSDFSTPSVIVKRAATLDGISSHMASAGDFGYLESDAVEINVHEELKQSGAELVICYLPVGANKAADYFARESLLAECGFINCVPVFLSKNEELVRLYKKAKLPIVGDDIKSQVGATAIHRALINQISIRGGNIINSYQLNYGGNSDFLNMLDRSRLDSKKTSKTNAVKSAIKTLNNTQLHIGPTEHISFMKDRKEAIIDIKWQGWAGIDMSLKVQLEVEDSPNSATVVADAIRIAYMAKEREIGGILQHLSAYCMKSPPDEIFSDSEAYCNLRNYIYEISKL